MGDQPYAMLLPWIFFAVVARHNGEGVVWGAIAALIAALTLLSTSRKPVGAARNSIALGAIAWFTMLGAAGLVWDNGGLLTHHSRSLSALGFVVICFVSLVYRPAMEYYSRAYVRPRLWESRGFLQLNYQLTLLWGVLFLAIATSHFVAAVLRVEQAYTVFNWIVPICLCAVGANAGRKAWYAWNDEHEIEDDPLHALALDYSDDWDVGL